MEIVMSNRIHKCWFICLLITGLHTSITHAYDDDDDTANDNNADISKRMTFDSLVQSMHLHHRARRAVGDSAAVAIELSAQSSITTNSTAIYIISGYSIPGATTEATTNTFQSSQITSISPTPSVTTNSNTNGTIIITGFYPYSTPGPTSSTTTSTTTTTTPTPISCNNGTHILLMNGTCAARESLIVESLNILNNNASNDTQKVDALSTYITATTNSSIPSNSSNSLTIGQIDGILGNLNGTNYNVSTNTSIIVITQPKCGANTTVIGASFELSNGPTVIDTNNVIPITNSPLSAAGVVNFAGDCRVNRFNVLIINDPTTYQNADNSTNSTLVSSIIMATLATNDSAGISILIQLYFQDLTGPKSSDHGTYSCAFYDTKSIQWNQSGCIMQGFNEILQRYECSCNHLTSFALIWLPKRPSDGKPPEYNAQDKASIAFQVISIVCFLGVVIHIITVRILHPQKYGQTTHLLPIMSCGVTIILFIFYIALGLTVYTRHPRPPINIETSTQRTKYVETGLNSRAADQSSSNSSSSRIPCLPNEHGLMFVVYFLIIFMFCTKTSIGIDNYRRYVQLFPPLSYRIFTLTMGLSLLISGIWLAFAAGFDSNPANEITEIYDYKLCWFSSRVNNYFLTIPVCLFLAVNLAMFIPVIKHNVIHVHEKDEDVDYCILRKRCIYILFASGGTQGFGWLFGPVISLASPTAGEVLGWFFIIFNGLEGLWALLLYIIVEKQGLDRTARRMEYMFRDPHYEDKDKDDKDDRQGIQLTNLDFDDRRDPLTNVRSDSPRNSFSKLPGEQVITWRTSDYLENRESPGEEVLRRSNRAQNDNSQT